MPLYGHIGSRRLVRTFIAFPTPDDIVRRLMKLAAGFQWPGCNMRWSKPDQYHLTVQFLGNVEWIEVGKIGATLKKIAAPFPPIPLRLTHLAVFPPRNQPRVIVAALEPNPTLLALVEAIQARLQADHAIVPEARRYTPHLTLGRVKSVADREAGEALRADLAQVDPALFDRWGEWEGDELTFFQSDLESRGAEYIPLSHAALDGGRDADDDEADDDEATEDDSAAKARLDEGDSEQAVQPSIRFGDLLDAAEGEE
ncbi:MAG: RNA 2',3'-cyclic phosphodiesterase [Planctomycetota bacterium]